VKWKRRPLDARMSIVACLQLPARGAR
jgi:hypothetical protein